MEPAPSSGNARGALGRQVEAVLASRGEANAVFDVLAVLQSEHPAEVQDAVRACSHLFGALLQRGELFVGQLPPEEMVMAGPQGATRKYKVWMRHRYQSCCTRLGELLAHPSFEVKESALTSLMKFVRLEGAHPLEKPKWEGNYLFPRELLKLVVQGLLSPEEDRTLLLSHFRSYLEHDDIRYHTMQAATEAVARATDGHPEVPLAFWNNVFSLLSAVSLPRQEGANVSLYVPHAKISDKWKVAHLKVRLEGQGLTAWGTQERALHKCSSLGLAWVPLQPLPTWAPLHPRPSPMADLAARPFPMGTPAAPPFPHGYSCSPAPPRMGAPAATSFPQEHRKVFQHMWLSFLKHKLPLSLCKKVLVIMHDAILPSLAQPSLMIDFLSRAYDAGGAISLLALNGLFILIHKHNLEYPDFYRKLYGLLDPSIFHVKYRARFFHLADLFLSSSHLPAYLVAAFAKRLARLALTAPPEALLMVLPFICNLLRRHPACRVLVHRPRGPELDADPYDPQEEDPARSRALESSLWELQALQQHYHPEVATAASAINHALAVPEVSIAPLLELSAFEIFERDLKKAPESVPLEFLPAQGLLGRRDQLCAQVFTLG
ncbi:nucleolar complex protein 4 homolog isoform X2 [Sorex araneus]|uniref:nucleolar complex protein 4 homolog isoform X2 n=1 Tax=Sorex araneus TaxID=42254 RepID=UPI002433DEE0|nr:nucleolar complex protein 4 homolog isoform X2 [Sorex araneus]